MAKKTKPENGTVYGRRYAKIARETKNGRFQTDAPLYYEGDDVKAFKGDSKKSGSELASAASARKAELDAQKNAKRNQKGQFLNKEEKSANARKARAKQAYDIKKGFGMTVG